MSKKDDEEFKSKDIIGDNVKKLKKVAAPSIRILTEMPGEGPRVIFGSLPLTSWINGEGLKDAVDQLASHTPGADNASHAAAGSLPRRPKSADKTTGRS